ncbi:MAG TPA: hypothetical protein VFM58_15705 [Solirubrobacteraceae bacterium]|nr:hypothetical protein [Solirubrobacteraceae bacterium]
MSDETTRLAHDADALRSAARRLHDGAAERAAAPGVPHALETIEDALTGLSRMCYAAAQSFVPLADSDDSVTVRYARAAEMWPSPRDPGGPPYEQQARVLSSLHDAGAALRSAARHCARAADHIALTMEPVERHDEQAA